MFLTRAGNQNKSCLECLKEFYYHKTQRYLDLLPDTIACVTNIEGKIDGIECSLAQLLLPGDSSNGLSDGVHVDMEED